MSITDNEDDDWEVPIPKLIEDHPYCLCLVGTLATTNRVNFRSLQDNCADLWKPQAGIAITDLGCRRYLFRFFHHVDIDRVLKGCPWDFNRHLLVLHRLQLGELPLEVPLVHTNIWVQVHGLQTGLMSESLAKQFGNFIGDFLEYDTSHLGKFYIPHMRIRVCIDIRKPLKRRKRIKISTTNTFFATFQYERLPLFCFICGIIGHGEMFCPVRLTNPNISEPYGWDSSLRVSYNRQPQQPRSHWLRNEDGTPLFSNSITSNNQTSSEAKTSGSDMDTGEAKNDPITVDDGNKRQRTDTNIATNVSSMSD